MCFVGAIATVDGGTCHLGDTAKVSVVGVDSATSGGSSVGMEESFGKAAYH